MCHVLMAIAAFMNSIFFAVHAVTEVFTIQQQTQPSSIPHIPLCVSLILLVAIILS
eukprot:m.95679 g.95679  ORF g.95679 m.95679 type:complete len:56 (+) comp8957_c0_seq2:224-391(+)